MNIHDGMDKNRRRAIKLLTGGAASSLLIGLPAFGGIKPTTTLVDTGGNLIDCQLIIRAGRTRAHLLMRNKTKSEIVAARFQAQFIHFEETTLNMADAYVTPVIIPPNDRVMVRLHLEAGIQNVPVDGKVLATNANTRYLPQGTGVMSVTARIIDGVATIENTGQLA